jgi:hypothetical protein
MADHVSAQATVFVVGGFPSKGARSTLSPSILVIEMVKISDVQAEGSIGAIVMAMLYSGGRPKNSLTDKVAAVP